MKRVVWLVVLVLLGTMLLGGLLLAQASAGSTASGWYVVEVGTATGGGYHLTGRSWHVDGPISGAGYQLEGPIRPLQGAGCCCLFLPCVFNPVNW
jgi:hypothetical protein